jgi:hypothetical protein
MPYMDKHRRGSGGWVAEGVTAPRRHYKPTDLGPLCAAAGCGTRIVKQLLAAGITEHPSCVPSEVRR